MKNSLNILVTGSGGQLGRAMRAASRGEFGCDVSGMNFIFSDIAELPGEPTEELDIRDSASVRDFVREHDVDVLVNCAAYTDVEAAEDHEAEAAQLNADAPAGLARVMAERGGLLLHISTDYVFGTEIYNRPCREWQTGTPLGAYGRTKLSGEKNVRAAGGKYVIIRTSWLYSEFGRNFCKTIMALSASRPSLDVVFDQIGTPTYAGDLAAAIVKILRDYALDGCQTNTYAKSGVYNYSDDGVCSWYDFARAIVALDGRGTCEIRPCHTEDYPSKVQRPFYSVLDKTKIRAVFGLKIPYWTDSLRLCIDNIHSMKL